MNEAEKARLQLIAKTDQRQTLMVEAIKLMPPESMGAIIYLLTDMPEDEFHIKCASSMEITKFLRLLALVQMCDLMAKAGERNQSES